MSLSMKDQEKRAFIIDTKFFFGYNVMQFGLGNIGATYEQIVHKVFVTFIGNTMDVYVDHMIIKILKESNHVRGLQETFKVCRNYDTKLN